MIFSLLGKGGSGKSTLSTKLTLYLLKNNNQVLAIDTDHNMDLTLAMAKNSSLSDYYELQYFIACTGHELVSA